MPHISRNQVKADILKNISSEFTKLVLRLAYQKKDAEFLNEFFTKTEQTMFAKRLAIIALLLKNVPNRRIQALLQVSPSTVARMQVKLETKRFKRVEALLKKTLGMGSDDGLLFGIMPSMSHKGMWKQLRDRERPE